MAQGAIQYGTRAYDPTAAAAQYGYYDISPSQGTRFLSFKDLDWSKLGALGAKQNAQQIWGKNIGVQFRENPEAGAMTDVERFYNSSYAPWDMNTYTNLWTGDDYFNKQFAQSVANNLGQINLNEIPKEVRARMGLDPNDNSETSVIFTDPTKPYWGATGYKKDGGFANWWGGKDDGMGQNLATIAAAVAAAYAAGSYLGAGAGTGGTEVAAPAAGGTEGTTGAGWAIDTPASLSQVGNSVGYTDAITGGAQAGNLVNAGGGLGGLVDAGMGIGGSGYGLIDAVAGAGTPNLEGGLLDKIKNQLTEKLKDPNNIKKVIDAFGGKSNQGSSSGYSSGAGLLSSPTAQNNARAGLMQQNAGTPGGMIAGTSFTPRKLWG